MLQLAFHRRLCFVGAALILHDRGIVAHHALAGQAHGRGIGQINAVVIAALLHVRVAHLCRQHTHDAELVGSDLERLPQAVAAKGHAVQIIADDAHLLVVLDVHVLQTASLRDLVVLHGGIVLVHAADGGPAVAVGADLQRAAAAEIDLRRDGLDQLRVLRGQLVHFLHRNGTGAVAPHLHRKGVGAQCRKAVTHALGHAVAQTHDNDDCHDTDDDAQHGKKGAQLIAPHVLDSLTEGLNDHAFSSSSGRSGSSVGCTMASGAWESPS